MSIVPGRCGAACGRAGDGAVRFGFPKLKFIGEENSDGFGGEASLWDGRTGGGLGAVDGLTTGGGRGMGAGTGSAGGGETSTGGIGGDGKGGSAGAGADGGADRVGMRWGGADGGGSDGGGADGGGSVAGGNGGVGTASIGGDGGVGGTEGVVCNSGFGSVGPVFRPLSNSIVTVEGGGNNSGLPSCRMVTSNSTPIAMWINSEIRAARRSRLDLWRGGRPESASIRRDPPSGMAGFLSAPQQEHALLPE
jgi:hypothetical protein